MQTAHELMIHGMQDMLDAERQLVKALGEQAEESSRSDLRKAFEAHQKQTEKHVERLQQAFEDLGEEPAESECAGIRGLVEEHENFKQEDPSADILDVFNTEAGQKIESYEIVAYESLIQLAEQMGHKKAERLFSQNLREEQQTLKKLQGFSKKIKPERMGMEDEAEEVEEERTTGRRAA